MHVYIYISGTSRENMWNVEICMRYMALMQRDVLVRRLCSVWSMITW